MNISVDYNDSDARALLTRAPGQISIAMRGGMDDSTSYFLAIFKRYPPELPQQVYRRTRALGNSMSSQITGSGINIVGRVGSNGAMAPYNRQVIDRDHQSRIHRGRWYTIQGEAERGQPVVQRMFDDRLRALGL